MPRGCGSIGAIVVRPRCRDPIAPTGMARATRPSGRSTRRLPPVRRCRPPRVAATIPWCARVGRYRDQEFVRNWSASAGFLDSPAQGTYQACVARGRRELLAAAPTPLLRQSPLECVKERIAFAHTAPYRPRGQGASVRASVGTTRFRRCATSLPSDLVQAFCVIAGSHLQKDAPLVIVCGRDSSYPRTTSQRPRRRGRFGRFSPPDACRRTGGVPPWADSATWKFARI